MRQTDRSTDRQNRTKEDKAKEGELGIMTRMHAVMCVLRGVEVEVEHAVKWIVYAELIVAASMHGLYTVRNGMLLVALTALSRIS